MTASYRFLTCSLHKTYMKGAPWRQEGRKPTAIKIMINIKFFNESLAKVLTAGGQNSLVRLLFTKARDGRNVVQMTCCDGKGLQIMLAIGFDGEPVEGVAIVNGNQLLGILRSYEALGFREFRAKVSSGETENVLTVTNGKGEHKLALADNMILIDPKEAQDGGLYAAFCNTKELQAAVRQVNYAVGSSEHTAGIYFKAGDTGYTLMATDCYVGAVAGCKADFRAVRGHEDADRDFFAGKAAAKAINAMHGDTINVAVTPRYILLRDSMGTMAVASLNGGRFPLPGFSSVLVGKEASMQLPHFFDMKVLKCTLLALADLAEAETVSRESKKITFRAVKAGEAAELFCGTQAADAELSSVDRTDGVSFSTALLKEVLNTMDDSVFVRFFKGVALFYKKDDDINSAYLMVVGPKKS